MRSEPDLRPVLRTPYGSLYQADCLEFLPTIKSGSVDMVFADPPFNLGKDYRNSRSDSLDEAEYLGWCSAWMNECVRALKPGGGMFVYQLPRWAFRLAVHFPRGRRPGCVVGHR